MKYQNTILRLMLFCSVATLFFAVVSSPASSQTTNKDSLDLAKDSRLQVPITLNLKRSSLNLALETLTKKTQIPFIADMEIGERRINIFLNNRSLLQTMQLLQNLMGFTWEVNGKGYRLFQTPNGKEREQAEIKASERWEEEANQKRRNAFRDSLEQARRNPTKENQALLSILDGYSSEQIDELLKTTDKDILLLSASGSNHNQDHLVDLVPFQSLTSRQQESIREATRGDENVNLLDTANVGVLATKSFISLAIQQPLVDGSKDPLSMLYQGRLQRSGILGVDSDNDVEPEINARVSSTKMLNLAGMAPSQLNRKIKIPPGDTKHHLSAIMEEIAKQTGFTLVSQDFLIQRTYSPPLLFEDNVAYTLSEVLDRLSCIFGQVITYRQGALVLKSVALGLALRSEPPAMLVATLIRKHQAKEPIALAEVCEIGKLNDRQWMMLLKLKAIPNNPVLSHYFWNRIPLQLFSELDEKQREVSETPEGLRMKDIPKPLLTSYQRVLKTGFAPTVVSKRMETGIYTGRKVDEKGILREVSIEVVGKSPNGKHIPRRMFQWGVN